jgi:exodeoxyribonuclease VII large subunit
VQIDCHRARTQQAVSAARLRDHSRRAVLGRARQLALLSRAPGAHLDRQRTRLHQQLREIRAGARRRVGEERRLGGRRAVVLQRKVASSLLDVRERRPRELERMALALSSHDPQRTLERGYVLARSSSGEPVLDAASARSARELELRFADGTVPARVEP